MIVGAIMSEKALSEDVEKILVVGEKLIEKNPWRNNLIKKQYELVVSFAMNEHRQNSPTSKIKILESYDNGPSDGFDKADKNKALGVLGYLYSTEAFEGSKIAESKKIPFITPVSPLNSVLNDFTYSLGVSHGELVRNFAKLKERFNSPSIVIASKNFLPNFEYTKVYQEAFNVVKTYNGTSSEIWNDLNQDLPKFVEKSEINVLFAGFAFEQIELVQLIRSRPYADKVRFISHSQWNFCPRLLSVSLNEKMDQFFVVSDYFNTKDLKENGFTVHDDSVKKFENLKKFLEKEPIVQGHVIDEPVVYVLYDMISMALRVAEESASKEEFNKKMSNVTYHGAAGTYQVENRKSQRKVYMGTWDGKNIKPLITL